MDSNEHSIGLALADLESGKISSIRAAAKEYNVPYTTLHARKNGLTTKRISHERQQRLTPAQEEFLAEWIIEQDHQGFPPSHVRVREMAHRILRMNGDTTPLGKSWVWKFKQRNPRVSTLVGRKIDAKRIDNSQPDQLRAFYDQFQYLRNTYRTQTENSGLLQSLAEDRDRKGDEEEQVHPCDMESFF